MATAILYERGDAFSSGDCDAILDLAAGFVAEPAGVLGKHGYAPDARVRNAVTTYLGRAPATDWLFARLDALFADAAAALAQPVGALTEPPQLVRYDAGGHFNTWHSDAGADLQASRSLSGSIELSAPGDYEGGMLEIVPARMGQPRTAQRGAATFFASRALHRVTPVTRGTRLALVVWA